MIGPRTRRPVDINRVTLRRLKVLELMARISLITQRTP